MSKLSAGRASWPKDLRRSTNRFPSRWTSSRQYCFFSGDKALHLSAGVPSSSEDDDDDEDDPGRIFLTREASTDELNPNGRGSGSRSNTPDSSNVSRNAHSLRACNSGAVNREDKSVLCWMLSCAGSGKKLDQVVASTSMGSMFPPVCGALYPSVYTCFGYKDNEETRTGHDMCTVVCSTLGVPFQEQDAVVEAVCGRGVEWREQDKAERGSTSYKESVC